MLTYDQAALLVGRDRLRPYNAASGGDLARCLELYQWNLALSASLWIEIEVVEILTRSAIAGSFFVDGVLDMSRLNDQTRSRYFSDEGSIKFDLRMDDFTFGFWVTLLSSPNHNDFWVKHIHRAFQPRTRRQDLHRDLVEIKAIRNRIGHHEPIWRTDIRAFEARVTRVLQAIGPDALTWRQAVTSEVPPRPPRPTWLP
jgi:hypothetical protein